MITITGIKEYTGKLKYDAKWNYSNGLPPLNKPELDEEYKFSADENVWKTNVDGFPYIVLSDNELLNKKNKFSFYNEQGMYSVTFVDNHSKVLEAKMDKVLDLTERTVEKVKEHYMGWGMKKEAEKVKSNYIWSLGYGLGGIELVVEGKLSKNQVIQYNDWIIKITELNKNEYGLIEIIGEHVDRQLVQPVYPYEENGKVVNWFMDRKDVLVKQGRVFVNKL